VWIADVSEKETKRRRGEEKGGAYRSTISSVSTREEARTDDVPGKKNVN